MSARLTMMLTAAIAIAAIAAGCGSDDDSNSDASAADANSGSTSSLSVTVVKQANAACQENRENGFDEIEAYSKKHRSEGLPAAVLGENALKATVVSIFSQDIEDLSKLEGSAEDQEGIETILVAERAALDKAKQQQKSNGKSGADIEALFADAEKTLRNYGLTRCAKEE